MRNFYLFLQFFLLFINISSAQILDIYWKRDFISNSSHYYKYCGVSQDNKLLIIKYDDTANEYSLIQMDTNGISLQEISIFKKQNYSSVCMFQCKDMNLLFSYMLSDTSLGIAKYTSEGVLLWSKKVGNYFFVSHIKEMSDNSYLLVGTSYGNLHRAEIMKVNSDGTFAWNKSLTDSAEESISDIVEMSDKNYLAVGRYRQNGPVYIYAGTRYWKFSPDGTLLWKKNNQSAGSLLSIINDTLNTFIIAGVNSVGSDPMGLYCAKINNNGETIWQNSDSIRPGGQAWNYFITKLSNNHFVTGGCFGGYSYLRQLNADGKVIRNITISKKNGSAFSAVSIGESIFLTGYEYADASTGWVAKVGLNYTPKFDEKLQNQIKTIYEDTLYTDTITAFDLPSDTLTYTLLNDINGLAIANNGFISWKPLTEADSGKHLIAVQVQDHLGQKDTLHYYVTVNAVNDPPVADSIKGYQHYYSQKDTLRLKIFAHDEESKQVNISWQVMNSTYTGDSISIPVSDFPKGVNTIHCRVDDGIKQTVKTISFTALQSDEYAIMLRNTSDTINEYSLVSWAWINNIKDPSLMMPIFYKATFEQNVNGFITATTIDSITNTFINLYNFQHKLRNLLNGPVNIKILAYDTYGNSTIPWIEPARYFKSLITNSYTSKTLNSKDFYVINFAHFQCSIPKDNDLLFCQIISLDSRVIFKFSGKYTDLLNKLNTIKNIKGLYVISIYGKTFKFDKKIVLMR
jgi:hypothetical protein